MELNEIQQNILAEYYFTDLAGAALIQSIETHPNNSKAVIINLNTPWRNTSNIVVNFINESMVAQLPEGDCRCSLAKYKARMDHELLLSFAEMQNLN
ncbi:MULTISPECIES: hypothetical protein [Persicobacter]|uniref:Uncharacterized protein n=1 Tax=Persicobacter diffluens TaxID=981 RepID=A0AAN5AM28_9BACT|nr:hypothetical protein [Persicobacter sp. CCB-QB2]GJM61468.1 hypothetical protein PEDI_20200 [Persicobacter diffluens]